MQDTPIAAVEAAERGMSLEETHRGELPVLHVVESLERGGLERMVCDLAAAQRQSGREVSIVCLFRRGILAAEAAASAIAIIEIGKKAGPDARAVLRLRKALRSAGPCIIHTHNSTAHYYAAIAAVGLRNRILVNTRHGMGATAPADRREKLFRWSLPWTSAVIAVCHHARTRFVRDGIVPADKATVIPNGIRLDRFRPTDARSRAALRRQLGVPEEAFVVGTVGRLNWAKDHLFLLDAFAGLLRHAPEARLIIVGDGELRSGVQEHARGLNIENAVVLAGDRPDVPELLGCFDVFALSSKTEGYSIALLEASAAGLPIVATAVGGNAEIVQQDKSGLLVAHGDRSGLTIAMRRLYEDQELRRRIGEAARRWAEARASVEAMKCSYEQLYSRFVRSTRD
jgi:glycosyltransferase involved in cell wall biosynthesis